MPAATLLRVEALSRRFTGLAALRGIDLAVDAGERRAVIGPNGAGKTTFFNTISGLLPPTSGRVWLDGVDVTGWPAPALAARGLARTFQHNSLFPALDVRENVRLAVLHQEGLSGRMWRQADAYAAVEARVEEVVTQVGLGEVADRQAAEISHGAQRQLELALALAGRPRLLLLDEPTSGMSPAETTHLTAVIAAIPRDVTVLIVEHDMDVVFTVADRITVLHRGEVLTTGRPEEVRGDEAVRAVYLGGAAGAMGDRPPAAGGARPPSRADGPPGGGDAPASPGPPAADAPAGSDHPPVPPDPGRSGP